MKLACKITTDTTGADCKYINLYFNILIKDIYNIYI